MADDIDDKRLSKFAAATLTILLKEAEREKKEKMCVRGQDGRG